MTFPPAPSRPAQSPRAFIAWLSMGIFAINLFVGLLAWFSLHQSRLQLQNRMEIQVQNLSQALELTIAGIIDKADVALLAVVDEAERRIASGGIDGEALTAYITRQHARIPELDGIRMSTERGDILYGTGVTRGTPVSIVDRDYFIHARTNPQAGLFIAKPVLGRVARKWVVNIARRINYPDGSFAGVAWGSLPLDYLLTLFSSFNIGRQGSITLRDGELTVIARYTEHQGEVGSAIGDRKVTKEFLDRLGTDPNNGTYTAHASVDKIERTFSYHKVSRYPLYIIVGRSTSDYLAEWRYYAAEILVFLAVFMFGTVTAGWLFYRSWQGKMQAQEELYRYHEALEAVVRERTTELEAFNYSVSHDLRRPLTNINTYCQVILELWGDKLDGQCKGYIQGTYGETLRMNELIDAMLKFSRLTNRELHREAVDLSELATEIATGLRMAEPARKVTFRVAEDVRVNGDPNLLRMVMENLLGNSWKYTATREEAVIEFGVTEAVGAPPAYFVRDNGVGFDMAHADKLFSPFQRLPGADNYKGHGIGLATVQRVIQRHGGKVWAEGEPGKGATFYFTL